MYSEGYPDAWAFWDMTPAEIKGRIEAFAVNRRREAEARDEMAWMVGYYVMIAQHSPRKFPKKPRIVTRETRPRAMTDDEMKNAMRELMKRQEVTRNGDNA